MRTMKYASDETFDAFMRDVMENWVNPGWEDHIRKTAEKYRLNPVQIEGVINAAKARYALLLHTKAAKA